MHPLPGKTTPPPVAVTMASWEMLEEGETISAHSRHNKSHLKSHPIRRRAETSSELSILRGISEGTDGSVTNTQEAAIVPGKAFSSSLLYLSRLNTFILIETSDKSESESAAWTGGRTKTFS